MRDSNAVQRDFRVDGISINVHSMPQAVSTIMSAAENGHGFCVFTLNLDHCNKLRSDPKFHAAYKRARFVTADGFPIVLLGRLNGVRVRRTTGADLLEPLSLAASRARVPIFILGPNQGVIARAAGELQRRVGELDVVGSYAPGANFDPESPDADMAIERIRRSGARLCFVALGAPRQEIFAARCLERAPGVGFVCVGAALDFLAGTQVRAPRFFQNNGLEWLWRLSSNPQRLAVRYLRCAAVVPRLLAGAIPQAITARRGRLS
jgi:exopolysaccharide biosynthesis WecB/TagA/CpsF family protein